jgi:hypothetical protein
VKIENMENKYKEFIDIDIKWVEDCSDEEVDEFRKNGFVLKTNTNYNKKKVLS